MTEIIVAEASEVVAPPARQASLFEMSPQHLVTHATEIADVLKDVIEKQGLFSVIGGNRHVKAEGWSTLGTLMGITPRENRTVRHEDGGYEAYVDLINTRNGMVVGGGSGFVGMDENSWKNRPAYARRSMAITRATSKAYKTCFSWIVALAGYNPTPAEEMEALPQKPQQASVVYDGSENQKVELAKIFEEKKIISPEIRKDLHLQLIKDRVAFDKVSLSDAIDKSIIPF